MLCRVLCLAFVVALAGCGSEAGSAMDDGSLVVDTEWLKDNLDDPNLQLVDTRAVGFEDDRIPGAIRLRPEQLARDEGGVPSQVAPPEVAQPVLREAGLRNDTIAVVYGEGPEFDPARIVWTLRYYGHGDVRYLDGGYNAWVADDGELDSGPPDVAPSDYEMGVLNTGLRVTSDMVVSALGEPPFDQPSFQIVDARSAGEFSAGRIPSARLVPWADNLRDGFLRSRDEIEQLHAGFDPATTTVTYCTIGWRGSFAWLALTCLGYEDVRLYDGSWAEWGNGDFPTEP